ncbi:MAG: glycosyltransferase family 39 protein [Labilithrix sp.]|nr:glycosyltransferase family 39 protein [Labilithrix sp.]
MDADIDAERDREGAREAGDRRGGARTVPPRPSLDSLLRGLLAGAATIAIGQVVFIALWRCNYPFELEWMEGAVVDHVRVVSSGQPLYRAPSIEFTPFIYTPFYYFVSSLLARAIGIGFLAPRLVSIASMIACLALIAGLTRREGASRLAALVAAGLFATTYESSGFWMDLARVDSLFMALALAGAYLARHGRSTASAAACGVALFLAFFTKQTGLTLAAPILAAAIAFDRRRGLVAAAVFATLTIGGVAWMNRATDGWFGFYVFDVPRGHDLRWNQWSRLLVEPFWRPVVVPVLLSAVAFFSGAAAREGRAVGWFYGGLLAVTLGASYSSMLHADGFANVLIPYYAATSIVAGVGLDWVLRATAHASAARAVVVRLQAFALVASLAHFGSLAYNPRRALPRPRDREAGDAMLGKLRAAPGPLLVLGAGYYAARAGHDEINAHTMALTDVFKTRDEPRKEALRRSILDAIRSERYAAVVFDPSLTMLPDEITSEMRRNYRFEARLFEPSERSSTWPRTGFAARPEELWVRKTPR